MTQNAKVQQNESEDLLDLNIEDFDMAGEEIAPDDAGVENQSKTDSVAYPDADPLIGTNSNVGSLPEYINFDHSFFTAVPGAYFKTDEHSDEAAMSLTIDMGSMLVRLPSIRRNLKLKEHDPDNVMLQIVEKSLKFVKWIQVGDPIPAEITSGKVSWEIPEVIHETSRGRVKMQLVSWHTGDEVIMTDANEIAQIANDPRNTELMTAAMRKLAEQLDTPIDQIERMVDDIAEELASIEALRGRMQIIGEIAQKLKILWNKYRSDRSMTEMLTSIRRMMESANDGFKQSFDELDAQTGEIRAVVQNYSVQVKFIRERRNDLFRRLQAWDEIGRKWTSNVPEPSAETQALVNETFRFLAQRFMLIQEWELMSKAYDKTRKAKSEKQWI